MNSVGQNVQEKIRSHESDGGASFRRQLETETKALKESVREAAKEIAAPGLLEAEASVEEVKPVLKKAEQVLTQAREKATRSRNFRLLFVCHAVQ